MRNKNMKCWCKTQTGRRMQKPKNKSKENFLNLKNESENKVKQILYKKRTSWLNLRKDKNKSLRNKTKESIE